MSEETEIAGLIAGQKYRAGEALNKGYDDPAVRNLAELGAQAVRPILAVMSGVDPSVQHPVDAIEALGEALDDVARRDPEAPIEILANNSVPRDPQMFLVVKAFARIV